MNSRPHRRRRLCHLLPVTFKNMSICGTDPQLGHGFFQLTLNQYTLTDANAWSNATTVNDPNNTTSVFTVRDSVPIINADKCFLRLGSPSCFLRVSPGDHEESLRTLQADAETLAGPADGFL